MGHLWDGLSRAYDLLGFARAAGGDEVFRQVPPMRSARLRSVTTTSPSWALDHAHRLVYEALQQVAEQGWSHVVLDGKLFRSDRCAETTESVKGETINSWYSGKHRAPGGNVQAVVRPDGQPIWVSDVAPGHLHDLTVARDAGVTGALNWAASQLALPTLADSGYEGAGHGVKTPFKQPVGGQALAPDNQAYNTLHRATRCLGERGFALLTGRWRALQRITVSPSRIGELAQAALVLTQLENGQLRTSY